VGVAAGLGKGFAAGMTVATIIAGYHWTLIRTRERDRCFAAFRHNNWLGAAIFIGIVLG
jgi:4-hydroxybenzoate polyprenyltransferase